MRKSHGTAPRLAMLVTSVALARCASMPVAHPDGARIDGALPDTTPTADTPSAETATDTPAIDAIVIDALVIDAWSMDAALDDSVSTDATTATDSSTPPPDVTCPTGSGPNATIAGALTVPNPTVRNLSVHWAITGDADGDGVVTVRYRAVGTSTWSAGMPLRRVPSGASWTDRHAGSIFDLTPDTEYEIEVALFDPDGGCTIRTVTARTRPVPTLPSSGLTIRDVTPATFASVAAGANPGDVLQLAAGNYAPYTFTRDGMPGRPIVIRSSAGAVFTGNFELTDRSHIWVEGLTINGRLRFYRASNVVIVHNTVSPTVTTDNPNADGIVAFEPAEDCYIADNVVTGQSVWAITSLGVSGANTGDGIVVNGPGHVVEHNRVRNFRDCVSFVAPPRTANQWSIDVVENDLSNCVDDAIEADDCIHNCRIARNRITNAFMGISSQPTLGGPNYFIRNVLYNVIYEPFKLHNGTEGDVILHNTIVKSGDGFVVGGSEPIHRALTRNNLVIGGPGGTYNGYNTGSGRVIRVASAQPDCDLDYDGFGSTAGMFTGTLGSVSFSSLAALQTMTTEVHAVRVDLSVFEATVVVPTSPFPERMPADTRLHAGGAAVDVGTILPNVNDGFAGAAPDLGAYELGAAVPLYGPRP